MSQILLGRTDDQTFIHLDIEILLRSKLLIQASSGGGKSRTLRRIAEQAFGEVPVIIIDPEGEFASLREKLDFLLVSADGNGDVPASVATAALLAERVLRTGISVVVDLYELRPAERHAWLRAFLDALMNAPRHLWRDYLILVDEAEGFAPESGEGESAAKSAVLDVAKRGRKRGYGLVLATLRVSRLDKSVLAEMQNSLVGLVTMDVDLDRAASAMGFKRGKPRDEFQAGLADLEPGYFFARGRAFSPPCKAPVLIHIENVVTTHPEPGARTKAPPPPPPTKIRGLLGQFADLPRELEKQASVEEQLRARIVELEGKLYEAEQRQHEPVPEPVQVPTVPEGLPAMLADLQTTAARLHGSISIAQSALSESDESARAFTAQAQQASELLVGVHEGSLMAPAPRTFMLGDAHTTHVPRTNHRVATSGEFEARTPRPREVWAERTEGAPAPRRQRLAREPAPDTSATSNGEWRIRDGVRRMLRALAMTWNPQGLTLRQLATLADVKRSGGTFGTYFGELRAHGCIEESGDYVRLTAEGRKLAGPVKRPVGGDAILQHWIDQPEIRGKCRDLLIYAVKNCRGRYIDKDAWGDACDVAKTGGTLGTYIGILVANGLVLRDKKRGFTPAEMFFK